MITIELEPTDLANIRFAYSPLLELTSSFYMLLNPLRQSPAHVRWVEEAKNALAGLDFPYMRAVILPSRYMADFTTPTPTTTYNNIEEEFERMRATPVDVIRRNIEYVILCSEETPLRRQFLMWPRESMECLIEEMRLYWRRTLAHHWLRIHSVLEGDMLYQARQLALYGVDTMFGSLSSRITYAQGILHIFKDDSWHDGMAYRLNGNGLQLVPTLVTCSNGLSWQITPDFPPMVLYQARGAGLWYQGETQDPEKALQVAMGESKAKMLVALKTPAHTVELAQRLNLTAGAVSQQLGRLSEAGLVESQRSSHRVYYRLTSRGEKLITLFTD